MQSSCARSGTLEWTTEPNVCDTCVPCVVVVLVGPLALYTLRTVKYNHVDARLAYHTVAGKDTGFETHALAGIKGSLPDII